MVWPEGEYMEEGLLEPAPYAPGRMGRDVWKALDFGAAELDGPVGTGLAIGVCAGVLTLGVPPPLDGVGAAGLGAAGGAGGGAGFFGGYRLAISSLTALAARSPLPSNTTLIFSVPDKPIL